MREIKIIAFDVDGTLTDGTRIYDDLGVCSVKFSLFDGYAINKAQKKGYQVFGITKSNKRCYQKRFEDIKTNLYLGIKNKFDFLKKKGIKFHELAYIGDDFNDLEVLQNSFFSACPKDSFILDNFKPDFITKRKGGFGAVREFIYEVFSINE